MRVGSRVGRKGRQTACTASARSQNVASSSAVVRGVHIKWLECVRQKQDCAQWSQLACGGVMCDGSVASCQSASREQTVVSRGMYDGGNRKQDGRLEFVVGSDCGEVHVKCAPYLVRVGGSAEDQSWDGEDGSRGGCLAVWLVQRSAGSSQLWRACGVGKRSLAGFSDSAVHQQPPAAL